MKRKRTTTTPPPPTGYGPLVLNSERRVVLNGQSYGVQRTADRAYAIQQSNSAGPKRLRFEVREGDCYAIPADGDRKNRAELCGRPFENHRDIWFAGSLRVLPGPAVLKWHLLHQFHSVPDAEDSPLAGSPPLAVELRPDGLGGEKLVVVKRFDAAKISTVKPAEPTVFSRALPRDRFYPIVGKVRFGWDGDGALEMWLGPEKVVDLPATSIGYNDDKAPYAKAGIYRYAAAPTFAVEWANLEVGFADLSARITSPLAIPAV